MRVSGVRSSWEALARSVFWAATSRSIRAAARLKLRARAATSSRPSSSTRAARSPEPSQAFEALGQAPNDREGAERDRHGEDAETAEYVGGGPQSERGMDGASQEPATVGQPQGRDRTRAAHPVASALAQRGGRHRNGTSHGSEGRAVRRAHREVGVELVPEPLERQLELGPWAIRWRQQVARQLGEPLHPAALSLALR
jgi:hypothetical protein